MSSTLVQYQCRKCKHVVGLGFRGEHSFFGLICRGCHQSCYAYPPTGETLWQSEGPYRLYILGHQWIEFSSKKGHVKKDCAVTAGKRPRSGSPLWKIFVKLGSNCIFNTR